MSNTLASLASQHHTSEYNRLKYGHRGCPVSYTPLSPNVVWALRDRQEKYTDQPRWWPCPPANKVSSPVIPAAKQRTALATGESILLPDLQQQLAMAISEPIALHPPHAHIKTSETHPINISQIIPPESLISISSHLIPCRKPRPVLFEIHIPYSTDLIPGYPQLFPSHLRSTPAVPPPQHKYLSSNLSNAVKKNLRPPLPTPSSRILRSLKRTLKNHTTSDRDTLHPISKSLPRRTTLLSSQPPQNPLPTLPTYALHPFSSHARPPTAPSPPNKISSYRTSKSSSRQDTVNQRPFKLGNLLLSSCPGKKVRLSGPVHGRSTVSRDLDIDLRRMKLLGARCVVCCLDDEELEFLIGASWTEYCQTAHQEGLDVLRLPIPEGLAPLSPKDLDSDLDGIIARYTLQGISVLVHCRGGVGRAGLFACCWMLKLGLCGWIETDVAPSAPAFTSSEVKDDDDVPSEPIRWDNETVVRRDTLQMVERVIEVVRRRRSVKAIETLEQVQFLAEFVDYLRTCGRVGTVSSD